MYNFTILYELQSITILFYSNCEENKCEPIIVIAFENKYP